MDASLVGVWNDNHYLGLDGPAEEWLIFKPDGTGRYEHVNYFLNWTDLFRWECPSPDVLTLAFYKTLTLNESCEAIVEKPPTLRSLTETYQVREEQTPSGKVMLVLRLSLPQDPPFPYNLCFADCYGLFRSDLNGFEDPDFTFTPGR